MRFSLLLFLFHFAVHAQDVGAPSTSETKSPGQKMSSDPEIQLNLGIEVPQYLLTFEENGNSVEFSPNLNTITTIGGGWNNLSLKWGFRNPVDSKDLQNKGSSTFSNYWLGYSFQSIRVDAFYGQFQGFYSDTPAVSGTGDQKYIDPNLTAKTFGASVTWVIEPDDFGLKVAVDQSERAVRSGGSWLVGTSYVETNFSDSQDILPAAIKNQMGGDLTIRSARFRTLNAKGGYGYTWKFADNWQLSGALQTGPGLQLMDVGRSADGYSGTKMSFKYDVWLSCGWSGERFFSGFRAFADGSQFRTSSLNVQSQLLEGTVFIGTKL